MIPDLSVYQHKRNLVTDKKDKRAFSNSLSDSLMLMNFPFFLNAGYMKIQDKFNLCLFEEFNKITWHILTFLGLFWMIKYAKIDKN